MQEKNSRKSSAMSDAQIEEVARLFSILSEPSRLKLLRALMGGEMTVTELMKTTGLKQGNVSKHLGVLLAARFVGREREGNFARYGITDRRLIPLCHLMCERVEDESRQRMRELVSY